MIRILFLLCLPVVGFSQHLVAPSNHIVNDRWQARWIGRAEGGHQYGVYHFRKSFDLKSKPHEFVIHLSADNRYRFFVNGTYVTDGPQISDARHWRFESLNIAPLLKEGKNVLAVQVVNFAETAPVYMMGKRTAMIMQGDDSLSSVVNTDKSWKYLTDESISPLIFKPGDPNLFYQYYAAGPLEKVDASKFPWGWETGDYNDNSWKAASASETGAPFGVVGYGDATWELVPRSIPLMERTYQKNGTIRRSSGLTKQPATFPITIPAGTTFSILIDQQILTSAFPELVVSGGKQSQIKVTYAEACMKTLRKKEIAIRYRVNRFMGCMIFFYRMEVRIEILQRLRIATFDMRSWISQQEQIH